MASPETGYGRSSESPTNIVGDIFKFTIGAIVGIIASMLNSHVGKGERR